MCKRVPGLQPQHAWLGSHSISRPSAASQSLFGLTNPQNVLSSKELSILAAPDGPLPLRGSSHSTTHPRPLKRPCVRQCCPHAFTPHLVWGRHHQVGSRLPCPLPGDPGHIGVTRSTFCMILVRMVIKTTIHEPPISAPTSHIRAGLFRSRN